MPVSAVSETDRAQSGRSRTCRTRPCRNSWKSERCLKSISQALRRMKSVLCYVKPLSIASRMAFQPCLSVSCQEWVVMPLRFLPLSRNCLTVASTSISRRNSSTCWVRMVSHPCSPPSCSLRYRPVRNWNVRISPSVCSQVGSNM